MLTEDSRRAGAGRFRCRSAHRARPTKRFFVAGFVRIQLELPVSFCFFPLAPRRQRCKVFQDGWGLPLRPQLWCSRFTPPDHAPPDSSHRQRRCNESGGMRSGEANLELQSCGRWGKPQPSSNAPQRCQMLHSVAEEGRGEQGQKNIRNNMEL